MKYGRRIERLEKKAPDNDGESWAELLDRLGLGSFKKNIPGAKSFLDVVTDQTQEKIWRR